MGEPEKPQTLPVAPKCPVCGEGLSQSTLVLCRACSSPHHRKCWTFNKGCATFGCGCRTYAQPSCAAEDIEFSGRGQPSLVAVLVMVPAFLFCLFGSMFLLPKPLVDAVAGVLSMLFVPGILLATLGPLLTETRFRLSGNDRTIYRQLAFAQVKLGQATAWKSFSEVEELELKLGQLFGQQGQQTHQRALQVVLRDKQGKEQVLETIWWADRDTVLGKVEAAADMMDTVVSLPQELSGDQKLPAGLTQAIKALPRREDEPKELPPGSGEPR